ncbi:unnamed protein product [Ostreobium quekettii]|uniref:Xanthine/uracil/vitamin C permease n=1 Tax=Ostreobium quekettii TaxID=121088 RepID=A0A8S1J3S5_9CHLO|nr:unnamed protein product [Ostreobium quekettii]|eukprot:evm.model.scf_115EXC.5 EVM.evm.TU.scf_115EXC.5   scf_115EXC:36536-38843(+)
MSFVLKELNDFRRGITFLPGDFGALSQLFFDNLSTLLGILGSIFAMTGPGFGASPDLVNEVAYGKIVPGLGLTILFGNIYYSWMCTRMTRDTGRPYTAQPYGINTPAAFAFIFNIMYPAFFAGEGTPDERFIKAYRIALAANFLTGLVSIVLSFPAPMLLRFMPPAALLVPIAGIGFSFLGIQQMSEGLAAPIVGYMATAWVFLGWYAGVRIGWGKFKVPEALQVIVIGVILGWATDLSKSEDVDDGADLVKWYGPDWSWTDLFADFSDMKDFIGTIIPLAIVAVASSMMCLVSAKNAGDPYPVREAMIVDGLGTMLVSLFGSPFGTVLYIGHPAYKRSGARSGYSLMNGVLYIAFSWFGIFALIRSIVNQATIGQIILFVGLLINEEALVFMPKRHYAAFIVGLFPSVCDWVVTIAGRAPLSGFTSSGQEFNTNLPGVVSPWYGILGWQRGALLVSMLWVSMLVHIIDRRWLQAAVWAFLAALFAMCGVIHAPEAGFEDFEDATWPSCRDVGDSVECWDHGKQWQYFVAYLMMCATFGILEVVGRVFEDVLPPPIQDETVDMFKDWYHVPEDKLVEKDDTSKGLRSKGEKLQDDPSTDANSSV